MFSDNENLAQRAQDKLGEDLPQAILDGMQGVRANFLTMKKQLEQRVASGELSPEEFNMQLNTLTAHAHNDLSLILGHERLQAIFGEQHPVGTIDKVRFVEGYNFRPA
jgi:hypothetical protein